MEQHLLANFGEPMAMWAIGLAAPLASFFAIAVGCSDGRLTKAKKRGNKNNIDKNKRQLNKSAKKTRDSKRECLTNVLVEKPPKCPALSSSSKSGKSPTRVSKRKVKEGLSLSVASKDSSCASELKKTKTAAPKAANSRTAGKTLYSHHTHSSSIKAGSSEKLDSNKKFFNTSRKVKNGTEKTATDRCESINSSMKQAASAQPVGVDISSILKLTPSNLRFNNQQAAETLEVYLTNQSSDTIAIKVKCSDNKIYRVDTVYTILQPMKSTKVSVRRESKFFKVDKLAFAVLKVSKNSTDARNAFNDAKSTGAREVLFVLPLFTTATPLVFSAASSAKDEQQSSGALNTAEKSTKKALGV